MGYKRCMNFLVGMVIMAAIIALFAVPVIMLSSANAAVTKVVTNTNTYGPGSLFEILSGISDETDDVIITFDSSLDGKTISMDTSEPSWLIYMTNNLTIDASMLPGGITITGTTVSYGLLRFANIQYPITSAVVTLKNITVTGSANCAITLHPAHDSGSKLFLALENCTLVGNGGSGISLAVDSDPYESAVGISLLSTTIAKNRYSGLEVSYPYSGEQQLKVTLAALNCSILGNGTEAILMDTMDSVTSVDVEIHNSTVTGNGGGIVIKKGSSPYFVSGDLSVRSSIITANGGTNGDINIALAPYTGTYSSHGFNRLGKVYLNGNLIEPTHPADITASAADVLAASPVMRKIAGVDYPMYYMPLADTAKSGVDIIPSSALKIYTDQRGNIRPAAFKSATPLGDSGAIELQRAAIKGGAVTDMTTAKALAAAWGTQLESVPAGTGGISIPPAPQTQIQLTQTAARTAAESGTAARVSAAAVTTVSPMPMAAYSITSDIPDDITVPLKFIAASGSLGTGTAGALHMKAALPGGTTAAFTFASSGADGTFSLTDTKDSPVSRDTPISQTENYYITVNIKDGSPWDMDPTAGKIACLLVIYSASDTPTPTPTPTPPVSPDKYPKATPLSLAVLKNLLPNLPTGTEAVEAVRITGKIEDIPVRTKQNLGCLYEKGYLSEIADGTVRIPPSTLSQLAAGSVPPLAIPADETVSMPVFTASLAPGGVGVTGFEMWGVELLSNTAGAVNVLKAQNTGNVIKFSHHADSTTLGDGMFMIMDSLGRALKSGDSIDPSAQYVLIMSIKDNGPFDLDPQMGAILDPGLMTENVKPGNSGKTTGGSMGGGCSVGLGLTALCTLPTVIFKKKG